MRGKTTTNQRLSLFEQLLLDKSQADEESDVQAKILLNVKNQEDSNSKTKSLRNLNHIFYSNDFDYGDYKQSLKYNNNNLKKIAIENVKNPDQKIMKWLGKVSLKGLTELKLKDIDIRDNAFQVFKNMDLPNLRILQLNCPEMTTIGLGYVLERPHQLQQIDLSNSKIDSLEHLCKQKNQLESISLQWCSKLSSLKELATHSHQFPRLKVIDSRFTHVNNQSIQYLMNSSLIFTLQQIRVFGTDVNLESSDWNLDYIMRLLTKALQQKKLQYLTLQNQRFAVENNLDLTQCRVNSQIIVDPNLKANIIISWLIDKGAYLQLFDTPEKERSTKLMNLFESLKNEWQLRETLKRVSLDLVDCRDDAYNVILNTVKSWKAVEDLNINLGNQTRIKPVSYFYTFHALCELKDLSRLELDLSNNKIEISDTFLAKILRTIKSLPYLNILYLNLMENVTFNLEDLKYFNYHLVKSINNTYLNHIYLLEDMNLTYKFEDAMTLYFSDFRKTLRINQEEGIVNEYFQQVIAKMAIKKRRLVESCRIVKQLKLSDRFHPQIIRQMLELL